MKIEKSQISATVDKDLSKAADNLAKKEHRSFSSMVEILLEEALVARKEFKPKYK